LERVQETELTGKVHRGGEGPCWTAVASETKKNRKRNKEKEEKEEKKKKRKSRRG
jgi:hypothetical protein